MVVVLLCALGITAFATAVSAVHFQFGCTFKDQNYALDLTSKPIYSEPIQTRLHFANKTQFVAFYQAVDQIIAEELIKFPYDSVEPYMTMFRQFKQTTESFKKFYNRYVPTYPRVGEDSTTALLRVHAKLIERYPEVAGSFVMGAVDYNTDSAFDEQCLAKAEGAPPPDEFQTEGVVGVIRFAVGQDSGVIILDMSDYKMPTPIVMENPQHHLNSKEVIFGAYFEYESTFTYSADYIVIRYFTVEEEVSKNDKVDDSLKEIPRHRLEFQRKDILHTRRSICSFLQSTEKPLLLNPVRNLVKYSKMGYINSFVSIDTLQRKVTWSKREYVESENSSKFNNYLIQAGYQNILKDKLSLKQKRYLTDVGNDLEIDEQTIKDKLKSLSKIKKTDIESGINLIHIPPRGNNWPYDAVPFSRWIENYKDIFEIEDSALGKPKLCCGWY